MSAIVYENQSWLDIALITNGSIECVFDTLNANDASLTDSIHPGVKYTHVLSEAYRNDDVAYYYRANRVVPATGFISEYETGVEPCVGGIGCWIIESDFIVQ